MSTSQEKVPLEPLDMSWPDTNRKRVTYLLILPLILPLWLTLPDTRKPESKKFFVITFTGSILWIAIFSYLMVWWATITGQTFTIPPEVNTLHLNKRFLLMNSHRHFDGFLTLFTIAYFTDDSPSHGVVITPPQGKLHLKFFLHQNFSLGGLRVSIADFGFEGPGFESQLN